MKHILYRLFCYFALMQIGFATDQSAPFAPRLINRQEALAAAQTAGLATYPNAEAVIVDALQQVSYNSDGTYEQSDEVYLKILTEEARRNNLTLESYFTIPYQRGPEDCRIDEVEIIKPDGTTHPIDVQQQSRISINSGDMDKNIYNPNSKKISVNVTGLEIGDVLHYRLYDRIVQARMADTWADWITVEGTLPIIRKTVEVSAPAERPLLSRALKDPYEATVSETITTNSDQIIYSWTAENVPRMFPEPNMPPVHTVVQRQLVSTVPDWEYISRWYWNLSVPHFDITPEIIETVENLTQELPPQEQIEALFTFVSQQIRYMGITVEATAPGYEPHDVKDTFNARHGVCRDKAALLVAMLRQAGFEAFPTLIHSGPKKDPEVPQPYFNHAIVAVRNADGSYQLMDPTDENTRQLFPAYLGNTSYLVATPEGDPLRTAPVSPAEENLLRITTTGSLTASGILQAETKLQFEGINDNAYRGAFANWKPEKRTRFLQNLVKRIVPTARIDTITITPENLMDTSESLAVTLNYTSESPIFLEGTQTRTLPLPFFGTSAGMVNFMIGKTGLHKRAYPLMSDIACGVDEQITLQLPATTGEPVSLPVYSTCDTNGVFWQADCQISNRTLQAHEQFLLKEPEYAPAAYLSLKKTLRQMEQDYKQMVLFARPDAQNSADAEIISSTVTYTLDTPHAWTEQRNVSRRILSYAGKKQYAELKLSFNPAWEGLSLDYARVISADGSTTSTISPQEINIMDAAWSGEAPRYPAAKEFVASFPAVEVGSVIEFQLTRTCSNRPFFYAQEYFQFFDPLNTKTVCWEYLSTTPLTIIPTPDNRLLGQTTPETADLRMKQCWSITNAPPVKEEDALPPGTHSHQPYLPHPAAGLPTQPASINSLPLPPATNKTP